VNTTTLSSSVNSLAPHTTDKIVRLRGLDACQRSKDKTRLTGDVWRRVTAVTVGLYVGLNRQHSLILKQ